MDDRVGLRHGRVVFTLRRMILVDNIERQIVDKARKARDELRINGESSRARARAGERIRAMRSGLASHIHRKFD